MTHTELHQLMLTIRDQFEQTPDLTERSAVSLIEEGIRQIQTETDAE